MTLFVSDRSAPVLELFSNHRRLSMHSEVDNFTDSECFFDDLGEAPIKPSAGKSFRAALRSFINEDRVKILKAVGAVARIFKTALAQTGGAGGGLQAAGQLSDVVSIGLGTWGLISIPLKILSVFDAFEGVIGAFNSEKTTKEKVSAVSKLCFKAIADLAQSLCTGLIFMSQRVIAFAPVRVISALGIAGAVFGLIHSFYELVGSAILAYELVTGQRELTGMSGAVLTMKTFAALMGLTLAVLTLVVVAGGVVFNPWVLTAVVAVAVLTSIIAIILEKTYLHMEEEKKAVAV